MHDVAADQPEFPFKVQGREDVPRDHRSGGGSPLTPRAPEAPGPASRRHALQWFRHRFTFRRIHASSASVNAGRRGWPISFTIVSAFGAAITLYALNVDVGGHVSSL